MTHSWHGPEALGSGTACIEVMKPFQWPNANVGLAGVAVRRTSQHMIAGVVDYPCLGQLQRWWLRL